MSRFAIRAEGIGKRFRRRHGNPYRGLHETLDSFARRCLPKGAPRSESDAYLWALRGVSFEIAPGEVVAVIGPNGAGKSVLCKVLSRVTTPTEGRAELRGRIGSMLEVGVGFHPDLTGRENVYFNAAILGMKTGETRRKFDEIVAFSEIEEFIDTPVKHYSSGMRMRLGFSVAAHMEPEILLIDEGLAVGDEAFQEKCRRRLRQVIADGRTLLLVSHQRKVIAEHCTRAILLQHGCIAADGPASEVMDRYFAPVQASI